MGIRKCICFNGIIGLCKNPKGTFHSWEDPSISMLLGSPVVLKIGFFVRQVIFQPVFTSMALHNTILRVLFGVNSQKRRKPFASVFSAVGKHSEIWCYPIKNVRMHHTASNKY